MIKRISVCIRPPYFWKQFLRTSVHENILVDNAFEQLRTRSDNLQSVECGNVWVALWSTRLWPCTVPDQHLNIHTPIAPQCYILDLVVTHLIPSDMPCVKWDIRLGCSRSVNQSDIWSHSTCHICVQYAFSDLLSSRLSVNIQYY